MVAGWNKNRDMNDNEKLQEWAELDCDAVNLEQLESKLISELEEQMADLEGLKQDREKIGNPDSMGETMMNVVWEQFINQVGVIAGEDFIKENRNLTLDLRDSAHIQTTENFAEGKIATHNGKINYQARFDKWQSNFQHDENGNVITHQTRTGREEATLVEGARKPFDKGRPVGSVERNTDMDHTVSAGEIIRDPAANAHLTEEEQIDFANSAANLNEMDAGQNRSKGDNPMTDWLDNPNARGQKPNEIYNINEEQDKQYREKDAEARAEYERQKKEGEKRSVETGKQSQKEEAIRIGGKALRAVVMGLLASLIKDIIRKLVAWFRAGKRKLGTFIDSVKEAVKSFVSNLKEHIQTAANTSATAIATAIFGPIIGMIKKIWIMLKQGYKSVKQAIDFLKNPANKDMPFSIKMMEVGKIVIAGLTAIGSLALGEAIQKGLESIGFVVEIPLIGSLASIIGMFSGALISGLVGALALNMIDRLISNRLKKENEIQQLEQRNEIIRVQETLREVTESQVKIRRNQVVQDITLRHLEGGEHYNNLKDKINMNSEETDKLHTATAKTNDEIANTLNNL